jgi:hypothetical protein
VSSTLLLVTAIAFALLSLTLLVAAARSWRSPRADQAGTEPNRSGLRAGLILFAVTGALFGSLWVGAAGMGWPRDRALWVGLGGFLGVMTLVRPWWFWDNWRARALRGVIGDQATTILYLALAGVLVWVGLYTNWTFGHR